MKLLVTGSSGLIGSCAAEHFAARGCRVFGVDNNMRRAFFGVEADTRPNLRRLKKASKAFTPVNADIRDRETITALFKKHRFDVVIHCAAQPSHDKSAEIPLVDFDINAGATANLLEATRLHCPEAAFILMSTNKVYGDAPNELPLIESKTRYDYARPEDYNGIREDCRIDQSLHSPFGASKTAADILAQEYGRYFGLNVGIFRAGCVTGPYHRSTELHGFLSYLVKRATHGGLYTIYGYGGKQVRDQIHCADVVSAFECFTKAPRQGEVYNMGGGRANSASVLELIALVERLGRRKLKRRHEKANRRGDHICYITDTARFKSHFPTWSVTRSLPDIITELILAETE